MCRAESTFMWSHPPYLCLPVFRTPEQRGGSIGQKRGGVGPYLWLRFSTRYRDRVPKCPVFLSVKQMSYILSLLFQGGNASSPTTSVPMACTSSQRSWELQPPCSWLLALFTSYLICKNTGLKLSSLAWKNEAIGAALARLRGTTVASHLCLYRMWAASWLCLERTLTTPLYYWEEIYWRHPSLSPASPLPSQKSKHLIFFVVNRFNVHLSVA